ncbi:E3.5.1.1 [Mytilus coruscus]|uniref:E3.5.1.1 n=1 Tax=Mytilus coruscus TaxID=42192 RepID=A0A6J8C3U6_MYTCO|nr:E3.5.1.1 [Mytilus coruscus]
MESIVYRLKYHKEEILDMVVCHQPCIICSLDDTSKTEVLTMLSCLDRMEDYDIDLASLYHTLVHSTPKQGLMFLCFTRSDILVWLFELIQAIREKKDDVGRKMLEMVILTIQERMPRKRRKPSVCQKRKYHYMNKQKLDMINKNQLTCLTPAVNIRNESKDEMPIDYPTRLMCRGKVNYCGLCNEDGEYTWKSGRIILQLVNGSWTISVEYDAIQKYVALSSNNICGLSCTSELKIQLCPSGGSTEAKCKNQETDYQQWLVEEKLEVTLASYNGELSPDTIKTVYCFTQLRLTLDFERNPVPTIIENMSESKDDSFNEYEIAPTQCKVVPMPGRISPRQHKVTPMPDRKSPMEVTLNQNQDKEALEHIEISPSEMEISANAETSYISTCQNFISTDTDSSSKVHLTQTTQLKCNGKMKLTGEELSLPKWRDGTLRMKCVNGSWEMDLDYYVKGGGMITINYALSLGVIIKLICKSQLIVILKPTDSLPVIVHLKPNTENDRNMIKMFHKLHEIQRTTRDSEPAKYREDTSGKRMTVLSDSSKGLKVIQTGATLNEELIRILERAATKPTIIQACSQNAQKNFADLCRSCKHDKILITHGTAKVAIFAEFLAKQDLHKTILLTADNLELDADFNVGFTLGVLQCLSERDIYIIRDGRLIHWSKVSHDTG